MSEETGKWLPYNKDGSSHDCRTNDKARAKQEQQQEARKQGPKQEKELTVQQLLDRLTQVGIIIDIKSIMKPEKQQQEE